MSAAPLARGGARPPRDAGEFPHVLAGVALDRAGRGARGRLIDPGSWPRPAGIRRHGCCPCRPGIGCWAGRCAAAAGCIDHVQARPACAAVPPPADRRGGLADVTRSLPLPAVRACARPGAAAARCRDVRGRGRRRRIRCASRTAISSARRSACRWSSSLADPRPAAAAALRAVRGRRVHPAAAAAHAAYCDTHISAAARRPAARSRHGRDGRWRAGNRRSPSAGQVGLARPAAAGGRAGAVRVAARVRGGAQDHRRGAAGWCCDDAAPPAGRHRSPTAGAGRTPGSRRPRSLLTRCTHARRALAEPGRPRTARTTWDLAVFGHAGRLSFTAISQPWLRTAAKRWAADDLPRRRGGGAGDRTAPPRHQPGAAVRDAAAPPGPRHDPGGARARRHRSVPARLAYLESTGQISGLTRAPGLPRGPARCSPAIRALGLTRPGAPAAGLGRRLRAAPRRHPRRPERGEPGRDLPPEIMRQLCEQPRPASSPAEIRTAVADRPSTPDDGPRRSATLRLRLPGPRRRRRPPCWSTTTTRPTGSAAGYRSATPPPR